MTAEQPDMERIVREVLRRLNLLTETEETKRPVAAEPEARQPEAPRKASPAPARRTGDLLLDSRLVTLASLEGRLDGVRRLLVPTRAVVTPSVRDELRKRKIRLEKQDLQNSEGTPSGELWIGRCTLDADATRRAEALTKSQPSSIATATDLRQLVQQAAEFVTDDHRAALLLTDRPLIALCLANRLATVRAAVSDSVEITRTAIQAIAANLLIVEPTNVTPFVWQQIIRDFTPSRPRDVPVELR